MDNQILGLATQNFRRLLDGHFGEGRYLPNLRTLLARIDRFDPSLKPAIIEEQEKLVQHLQVTYRGQSSQKAKTAGALIGE